MDIFPTYLDEYGTKYSILGELCFGYDGIFFHFLLFHTQISSISNTEYRVWDRMSSPKCDIIGCNLEFMRTNVYIIIALYGQRLWSCCVPLKWIPAKTCLCT